MIIKQQETTLVQRACAKVAGFKALHKRLEKKIIVSGKSGSTQKTYFKKINLNDRLRNKSVISPRGKPKYDKPPSP